MSLVPASTVLTWVEFGLLNYRTHEHPCASCFWLNQHLWNPQASQHQAQWFGTCESGCCYRMVNVSEVRQSQTCCSQGTVCLNYVFLKPNEKFCSCQTDFKDHKWGQLSESEWDYCVAPDLVFDKVFLIRYFWCWSGAVFSEDGEVKMSCSWKLKPACYCGRVQPVSGSSCTQTHSLCGASSCA